MTSSRQELESAGENDGIVFGSVLVTVPQEGADESAWAFLGGRKAADLDWVVHVSATGLNPFKTNYTLRATPGKEELFAKRMPAGTYAIDYIEAASFIFQFQAHLGFEFEVNPRQTTYIGRLLVGLPERLHAGQSFPVSVQDAEEETAAQLHNDFPSIGSDTEKVLARPEREPGSVPGNTVALLELQQDTLRVMTAIDAGDDTTCGNRAVVNTEVIKWPSPDDQNAQERWTLDRCGTTVLYRVDFRATPDGGTDISVNQER